MTGRVLCEDIEIIFPEDVRSKTGAFSRSNDVEDRRRLAGGPRPVRARRQHAPLRRVTHSAFYAMNHQVTFGGTYGKLA